MVDFEALLKHLAEVEPTPFGLLTHQALPTTSIVYSRFGDRLAALFAPEHGFFGIAAAGEKTASTWHPFWNVPVHSLYGETRRPTPEMLKDLGRIVIDLQDIGVRCFTYLATLKLTLEAAAEAHLPVTVVDRPTPLGGILDGPLRPDPAFASFVAPLNLPFCHGMTPGEAATWIVREEGLDLDLTVIKMRDWSHADRAPWMNFVPPSPAIRSWDSAAIYPATVFTEAFPAVDCDRSGSLAFRVVGAPWIDVAALLKELSAPLHVCGLALRPYRYEPAGGAYAHQRLDGLLLQIENPSAFYPVTAGVLLLAAITAQNPSKIAYGSRPEWLDKLMGGPQVAAALRAGEFSTLFQSWIEAQDAYLATRVNLYEQA